MLYEVITRAVEIRSADSVPTPDPHAEASFGRGLERALQVQAGVASGSVITSYSIHYTKLYDLFTKAENRLHRVQTYRELFSSFHIPVYEICKSEYISRSLEKSRTIWECGPSSYAARDYRTLLDKGFPVRQ